jgi:hypothetical protein
MLLALCVLVQKSGCRGLPFDVLPRHITRTSDRSISTWSAQPWMRFFRAPAPSQIQGQRTSPLASRRNDRHVEDITLTILSTIVEYGVAQSTYYDPSPTSPSNSGVSFRKRLRAVASESSSRSIPPAHEPCPPHDHA